MNLNWRYIISDNEGIDVEYKYKINKLSVRAIADEMNKDYYAVKKWLSLNQMYTGPRHKQPGIIFGNKQTAYYDDEMMYGKITWDDMKSGDTKK
jgi:hypothetical protein